MVAKSRAPLALTLFVLGLLDALGPLSIDLYLPAFPALQQDLHLSDAELQATLATMTIGMAVGQAFIGTWSDRVGRRRPLLLSAALHAAATTACAAAPSFALLTAFRLLQGIGAAGCAVVVLAMVRDLTSGREFVSMISRVVLITTTAPLIAPVVGAALLPAVGWRGIFAVLAAASALLLIAVIVVVPDMPRPPPTASPRGRLRLVLSNPSFLRYALIGAMTYGGVYAYVAASPLLLQRILGLPPSIYALAFLVNSLGLVAGVQVAGRLSKTRSAAAVLAGFASLTLFAAVGLLSLHPLGLPAVLPCLWLFVVGCGGCFPGAVTGALRDQGARAGTAASAYGFVTFASASLVAPLPGLFGVTDATSTALVLTATASVSLLTVAADRARTRRRRREVEATEDRASKV